MTAPGELEFLKAFFQDKQYDSRDVYKTLYQRTYGPAHILRDIETSKRYLEDELNRIKAEEEVEMLETISADGSVARLNLQRAKYEGMDSDRIMKIVVRSAGIFPVKNDFLSVWNDMLKWMEEDEHTHQLTHLAKSDDPPPVHHSERYRKAHKPHYRVVLIKEFRI